MKFLFITISIFSFSCVGFADVNLNACQSAAEIENHIANTRHAAAEFCLHTVTTPTHALKTSNPIPTSKRLSKALKVAILNSSLRQDLVASRCATLGKEWHPPFTLRRKGVPRAAHVGNSLEALGDYLSTVERLQFWSGSKEDREPSGEEIYAFWLRTADNFNGWADPYNPLHVVCVSP